jgi:hypothetical protein
MLDALDHFLFQNLCGSKFPNHFYILFFFCELGQHAKCHSREEAAEGAQREKITNFDI